MITSLRLVDFKNFRDATLGVGSFTVIVGANASGKSNIRDAFRFLHGIGRGYTLAEIAGGRYGPGGQQEWEPIRGATTEIAGFGQPGVILGVELSKDVRYSIQATLDPPGSDRTGQFHVNQEELVEGSQPVFQLHGRPGDEGELRMASTDARIRVRRNQPALTQIHEQAQVAPAARECARRVTRALASTRFLDLSPARMRQPAFPSQTVLGDRGENLPSVLQDVCADPQRKRILIDWIDELSPAGVKNLEFRDSPFRGRVELGIREENDLVVSADSASDGTLRLLGVLAALLGKDPAGLYFFEEVENGIHPARLWLLIDLIEKWTVKADIQVVTTTHSPTLLCGANDDTFEHTSVVWREEHAARAPAIIRPLADLPDARSLRKSQGLDRLHHSGWMETALAFTHDRREGEERERMNVLLTCPRSSSPAAGAAATRGGTVRPTRTHGLQYARHASFKPMRLHIALDDALVEEIDRSAGPRRGSAFVAELLRRSVENERRRDDIERDGSQARDGAGVK